MKNRQNQEPRRRRIFQVSLRSFLVLVFAVACCLGWIGRLRRSALVEQSAAKAVLERGGEVYYSLDEKPKSEQSRFDRILGMETPPASEPVKKLSLLSRLCGVDLMSRVTRVDFGQSDRFIQAGALVLVNDNDLDHLTRFKQLKSLDLSGTEVTDAGLTKLSGLSKLERLSLGTTWVDPKSRNRIRRSASRVTDAGLQHIQALELVSLNLSDLPISDAGAETLAKLTSLEDLNLTGTMIGDAGLQRLASLTSLKRLTLVEEIPIMRYFTTHGPPLTKTTVNPAAVERLQRALPYCEIVYYHDTLLPQLAENQNNLLAVLHDSCKRNSDGHIVDAFLRGWRITDKSVGRLRELTHIEKLDLDGTYISDIGLEEVVMIDTLRELRIGSTLVTDDGLRHLEKLKSLRVLYLHSSPFTDGAVSHLCQLKGLEYLSIVDTQISAAGAQRLRASLLDCKIDTVYAWSHRATEREQMKIGAGQ